MTEAAAAQDNETQAPRPWAHGLFYWNELMTHDGDRARKFYANTLGWTYEPFPMEGGGTYWVAESGPETVGGIFVMTAPEMADVPECWMSYIAVDDVDARVAKALAAGATLVRPVFDMPKVGRIALLHEPGGAVIGWMTPANG